MQCVAVSTHCGAISVPEHDGLPLTSKATTASMAGLRAADR